MNKTGKSNPPPGSLLSDSDIYLFNEGSHFRLYEKLGSHHIEVDGCEGVYFAVWAPEARRVSVIGDFNNWDCSRNPLCPRGNSGIWECFIPFVKRGSMYKYHIQSNHNGYRVDKGDPFAFHTEVPPKTASIIWDTEYHWGDQSWMDCRREYNSLSNPISIYEVHPGSWRRIPEEGNRFLTYKELAVELTEYVKKMGFTHVEFLPVMEHPFFGSWGYQVANYFAPTSRYGTPQDLMFLIDYLHQHGIGVILDWVPSHFPNDKHALAFFDGSYLYDHSSEQQRIHPDWKSHIFNYGRHEVTSFLISSGLFWLDKYHADGLRVDAVASMLYLDYGRQNGDWIPNKYGGRENLEAIKFLRRFNVEVYRNYPDVQTMAEESTAWPMVSRPAHVGGLGFGLKWDMGWMHDTLEYISLDPVHRKYHQKNITFRLLYAYFENFIMPLSHDEVVHGKSSLLSKMPGDARHKFANVRLLLGYMYAQAGKKLLFMGDEFGQWREWNHDESLDWHLTQYEPHIKLQQWVADLNRIYRSERSLYEKDCNPEGFQWVDCNDAEQSVISFLRRGNAPEAMTLIVCNFTPIVRYDYRVGVPLDGIWEERLNSDSSVYGGNNFGNLGGVLAEAVEKHGHRYSLHLTLPPLAIVFFQRKEIQVNIGTD